MVSDEILLYERRGDTIWLVLNRPHVRNALSRELVQALRAGFDRAAVDPDARAVVLAGAGPVFCAGADLNQYREASDREQLLADAGRLFDLLEVMTQHPKPIVARVQRAAYAGAFGLLCAADLVVAADDARFSLSEARLGLVASAIGTTVIRAIGLRNAKLHMLLAEPFGVDEALRIGMVHRVVPEHELDAAVEDWLRMLRAGAPGALRDAKRIAAEFAWGNLSPRELRLRAITLAADRRVDEEGQEGMASFLEKRRPRWNPGPTT